MYDAQVEMRTGSIRPVTFGIAASKGVCTIQSGGTVTIYDQTGAVLIGPSALSGYDLTPMCEPEAWYIFDTTSVAVGVYSAIATFQAIGSDGIARTFRPDVQVTITPAVEMLATYDDTLIASTPLYQARLAGCDTKVQDAIWTDGEWNYYLSIAQNNPNLAASLALTALSIDKARLANAIRIGAYASGEKETFAAILAMAKYLRSIAITSPTVRRMPRFFRIHGERDGTVDPQAQSVGSDRCGYADMCDW